MLQGATRLYYTFDHLGSVRQLLDDTGNIVADYRYTTYGERTKVSGDGDSDFGYAGLFHHQASGLDLATYRLYDAKLQRWTSRDPLGEGVDYNLYRYAGNNPVNGIDPKGLTPVTDVVQGTGEVVIGITLILSDGPAPAGDAVGGPMLGRGATRAISGALLILGATSGDQPQPPPDQGGDWYWHLEGDKYVPKKRLPVLPAGDCGPPYNCQETRDDALDEASRIKDPLLQGRVRTAIYNTYDKCKTAAENGTRYTPEALAQPYWKP